ncbi:hypothetical protein B0H14DRAFT_3463741 [Mycena olivaceomarginata]|nr:hypothetical protein B0H14DRAFT_3463741 [Mycena olivaceomarginata]
MAFSKDPFVDLSNRQCLCGTTQSPMGSANAIPVPRVGGRVCGPRCAPATPNAHGACEDLAPPSFSAHHLRPCPFICPIPRFFVAPAERGIWLHCAVEWWHHRAHAFLSLGAVSVRLTAQTLEKYFRYLGIFDPIFMRFRYGIALSGAKFLTILNGVFFVKVGF